MESRSQSFLASARQAWAWFSSSPFSARSTQELGTAIPWTRTSEGVVAHPTAATIRIPFTQSAFFRFMASSFLILGVLMQVRCQYPGPRFPPGNEGGSTILWGNGTILFHAGGAPWGRVVVRVLL